MNLLTASLLLTLTRRTLLILSPSLPLQALALLLIRGAIATILATRISILLGLYTILIYARGLLVLLAYFVALTPDQTLNTPSRTTSLISTLTIILLLSQTYPTSSHRHLSNTRERARNVITILTPSASALLIIIALILVLTIIAVVKVSRVRRGPIRPWRS